MTAIFCMVLSVYCLKVNEQIAKKEMKWKVASRKKMKNAVKWCKIIEF